MRLSIPSRKTLIVAALATLPLAAAAELSFNIGAVSLYKSRGIDQNAPNKPYTYKSFKPAIQGGVDYSFSNGIYIGNWNSTGRFGDADLEMDFYVGYSAEIATDVTIDLGLVRYLYPSSGGGWNGNDAYIGLTYGPVSAKYYQGVSGSVDKNKYLTLGLELPISDAVTFNASLGWSNPNGPSNNFNDYSIGVSYDLGNDLSATMSIAGANKRALTGDPGKSRLIVGISKSF